MNKRNQFTRVENPDGHQVCKVDEKNRIVEIKAKRYKTTIHFCDDGTYVAMHQMVEE